MQPERRLALLAAVLAVHGMQTQAYVVVSGQGVFKAIIGTRSIGLFWCAALVGHRVMTGAGITRPAIGREPAR